ncbi:hypothetical protein ISF_07428 [Cordyceps fumosorosea ARSEF 2679]|uniref:Uncharacterized protein n=1 Tax=Cordyceps fumosorosea (strain ARSEF 2679) TaxID=1081104 RepID=A0A167PQ65_CORFA|nr:hypothetical protein ISF_07428 [Cordyceps fumosorosea ARSEF 2679]OAA56912.1 hypothetical protein ISF_07428 [Cordyceps fumosorosea ARSEF 2679]
MNWNNGQLARHSRRSYNNDTTKQKQYFAQAKRQKITEPRKRKYSAEDFVPSYLEDLPEKGQRPSQDTAQPRESRRRLLTLQDAPPTVSKSDASLENTSLSSHFTEQYDTSIDAKRRKLLQQSDWSGVELQKPVIINITTPNVYRIAEACHQSNRLSALPYKRPVPAAPEVVDEEDNIMWKRFVLGPSQPVVVESAAHCSPDILDAKECDSRGKLGVQAAAAAEAPTRSASRLLDNVSPVPDPPRPQGPTPAPAGSAPPPTVSAEGPCASLSNDPQRISDEDGAALAPVYFREQEDSLEAMTAHPTGDALLGAKPESTTFHPPSLFVGRLATSERGASRRAVVAAAAPTSEPATEQSSARARASIIPARSKAPSARVMSRKRRNKRREDGRPDIRALPNIQGDPIEYTP